MRQRIKELRWVDAVDLAPDERNWRKHPKAQRAALQAMLDTVGITDALIARETPDGLVLVDGHLRQDMLKGEPIPVLIVDLDEAEAGQVLSTLDPLTAMAQTDLEALRRLVEQTHAPVDWDRLMPGAIEPPDDPNEYWQDMPPFENPGDPYHRTIHIHFYDEDGVDDFLKTIDRPNPTRNFIHWPEIRAAWGMLSQRVYDEETE